MDAEVFRPINIRAAVAVHEIPERAVRHVLHRGEGEERRVAFQQRIELLLMIHRDTASGLERMNQSPMNVSNPFKIRSSNPIL